MEERTLAVALDDSIDAEKGALASHELSVGARDRGGYEEDGEEGARQQDRLRPEDEKGRTGERDQREHAGDEQRQAVVETHELLDHDRESPDDTSEREPGDEQVAAAKGERRRGQESGDGGEGDRILVHVGEDERSDQRDEQPSDQPSGREKEVEAGQIGRRGTETSQGAVTVERGDGEDEDVHEAEREDRASEREEDGEGDEGRGKEAREDVVGNQLAAGECVHEGSEVERERQGPQKGYRRHVRREVSRHSEQQGARDCRQREDAAGGERFRVTGRAGRGGGGGRRRRAEAGQCTPEHEEERSEAKQGGAPEPGLPFQTDEGLDEERVGEQGPGRARVRGGVKKVRIGGCGARAGPCEPRLDQRGEGRGGHEGQPEGTRQGPEQPERGRKRTGNLSEEAQPPDGCGQGCTGPEDGEKRELPPGRSTAHEEVRKRVAREQGRLEEHHCGVPYRRRASEDRQDAAHRERLDPEDEPRGGEDDEPVEPNRRRGARRLDVNRPPGAAIRWRHPRLSVAGEECLAAGDDLVDSGLVDVEMGHEADGVA